jgi:hypothetical protein
MPRRAARPRRVSGKVFPARYEGRQGLTKRAPTDGYAAIAMGVPTVTWRRRVANHPPAPHSDAWLVPVLAPSHRHPGHKAHLTRAHSLTRRRLLQRLSWPPGQHPVEGWFGPAYDGPCLAAFRYRRDPHATRPAKPLRLSCPVDVNPPMMRLRRGSVSVPGCRPSPTGSATGASPAGAA